MPNSDFEEIYRLYFKDVFLYMQGLSLNESIAEEITQETFVKALKSIDKFDGKKDIRAWLFTIAKNTYFTYCKRRKIYVDNFAEDTAVADVTLTDSLENEEKAMLIHKFLHNMDEPYKEVFNLRVFGELPFDKIGLIFDKSSGWARVTFYRAKKQISEYMEGLENET